ncbi:hypothetical protein RFI_27460, partial [Reticulomyxa filosa]
DRRTVVCKEACKQLSAIIKYRQKDFYPFVGYFIERCLEIIRSNIQVMSQSGDECVTTIVTSIPESADTYLILRSLVSAAKDSNSKYTKSKEHIMKYVRHLMLQSHNATLLKDNTYTDELCAIIAIGCEDADATVRSRSFEALKTLQLNVDATKAQTIVDHLSPGALRKYQQLMNDEEASKEENSKATKAKPAAKTPVPSKGKVRTSVREMREQMQKKKQQSNQNSANGNGDAKSTDQKKN